MNRATNAGTRLTLDLWHPNCWAIEATEKAKGGILAHAIYSTPRTAQESVNGLFTAFGDTDEEIEQLLKAVRGSEHAGELLELQKQFGHAHAAPGNLAKEFFLKYDPNDMVCPSLLKYGFVHSAPARIENGRERWHVRFTGEQSEIENALDSVSEETGAELTVASITSSTEGLLHFERNQRFDSLTPAQREALEYAQNAGYYEWPRECSTRELAAGLDISKTTLLEHLRKAEAKLLGSA